MFKSRKYIFFAPIIVIGVLVSMVVLRADNENEYENGNNSSGANSLAQTKTTVSTSAKTINIPDSDGDGLIDSNDPHPTIPEIYIVEDVNLNGIVDKFEK